MRKIGALEAGGTKMVLAVYLENGQKIKEITLPTQEPAQTMPPMICFFEENQIDALGVGSFGPLDLNPQSPNYGSITSTPKLAWRGYPLLKSLLNGRSIPAAIDTDVNAAILAEKELGAAQGCQNAVYVTVGTGIGGGVLVNGQPVHGMLHPEVGHMLLRPHPQDPNPRGVCPYHDGCLEGLAAGPAIGARVHGDARELPDDDPTFAIEAFYLAQMCVNRKALEAAAAGGHNLLMAGVPGSGKTMLARCLPGILPPLSYDEALETTLIHSAAGELAPDSGLMTQRPFRSPHHNISVPAMIGGGAKARPGEVSLAHNGVLFLDELPEFQRATLEALRQPLEDGFVNITRISGQNRYQSHCMLVAGMNPCPCGNLGSKVKPCRCSEGEIRRYLGRISGPLLDRIDLQVEMDAVTLEEIESTQLSEDSLTVRQRVMAARERQRQRYQKQPCHCNAQLDQRGIEQYCQMQPGAKTLLRQAVERFHLSMRTYGRIRKVARTLADLNGHELIETADIAQAIQFRNVNGQFWREA